MQPAQTRPMIAVIFYSLFLAGPAAADSRIEKELALDPGGELVLRTDRGSVQVTGGSGPGATVVITSDRSDIESLFDFRFEESEGRLEITARRKGKGPSSWFNWGSDGKMHYEIRVPSRADLDIDTSGGSITVEGTEGRARLDTSGGAIRVGDVRGDVSADTSGGSITVERVDGDVDADTSGGSIHVEDVRGNVRADTSGGSIRIRGVTGDLSADTSGGWIRIEDAGGEVIAETSGGSVEVAFAPGNGRGGTLSTSGGGIRVALDPSVDLQIDAEASGGSVVSDIPIQVSGKISKSSLRGTLGSGGERLKLRCSGGRIRIEQL